MEPYTQIDVQPGTVLGLSVVVLFIGAYLTRRIRVLHEFNIPPAVVGGLVCSIIVAIIHSGWETDIVFDMQIRDVLLLVFFSTIGLSAKMEALKGGGKTLAILVGLVFVVLVFQDITGIALAGLFGVHPGYGLMAGSVSLAGGHGTAIAWGAEAEAAGLEGASTIGLAFATFGLIVGGLLGGPIARWLILKNDLATEPVQEADASAPLTSPETAPETTAETPSEPTDAGELFTILKAILALTICVGLGDMVNVFLFERGVLLPGFLTAMFIGILIANISGRLNIQINSATVDKFGEVSLNIFLAMSLMSIQLWSITTAFTSIMVVLMAQTLMITLVAVFVVFRLIGRDYDACVISAGFVGLGMGATPVAIANMDAVTSKYGPSPKAFLIVPLIGAFFVDILNAVVVKFFIGQLIV